MNSKEIQFVLDWLHTVIEDNYVLCYVIRFRRDLFNVYKCCSCRLYKEDNKFKLELNLPDETVTIKQEDGIQLNTCEENSILLRYRTFPNSYEVRIFPVKRVAIPSYIEIMSEDWNTTMLYKEHNQ